MTIEVFSDAYFMNKALALAMQAYDEKEVPIGALVVHENKIIGKGYNQTETLQDVTAHAEMLAITAASHAINGKYLDGCTLYSTIEPCLMCAGAMRWARLSRVVWGAQEPKFGFSLTDPNFFSKAEIAKGVLAGDCSALMKQFFKERRNR
ncbi:MAG: nucleoside deaminase [Flavobacteriaceae bacterium]|nr:nucleoside deaminase [Flavobacteriaceae bacterium]